jgi:hypothetical protein
MTKDLQLLMTDTFGRYTMETFLGRAMSLDIIQENARLLMVSTRLNCISFVFFCCGRVE